MKEIHFLDEMNKWIYIYMGILKVKTIWFVLNVVVEITQKNCYSKAFGWLSSCWPQDNLGPHIFSYFIWKNRFVVPRLFRILKLKYAEKTSKIKTRTSALWPICKFCPEFPQWILVIKDPFIPLAQKDLLPNDGSTKPAQKFWSKKLVYWGIFSAFATSVFSVCPGSTAIFGQKCHATFLNFKNWEVKY